MTHPHDPATAPLDACPLDACPLDTWWNACPSGLVMLDEHGRILAVNAILSEWRGVPAAELAGQPASELFSPASRALFIGLLDFRLAVMPRVDEIHLALKTPTGESMPVLFCASHGQAPPAGIQLSLTPIHRKDHLESELIRARSIAEEALAEQQGLKRSLEESQRELQQHNSLLLHQASMDDLTGLFNRRVFEASLSGLIAQNTGEAAIPVPFALAMLDIDHFKRLNDTHGHPHGDEVLAIIGELMRRTMRAQDLAARIGGEEFALLMPDTQLDAARHALARLRHAFIEHPWPFHPVTFSAGLTRYRPGDTLTGLVARADRALYAAKHAGRDNLQLA